MKNRLDFATLQAQLNACLCPDSIELDGRDIRDRLAFVADLSELILFYDEQNQPSGDWRKVVLKDPVILLAVISKTVYQSVYFRFNQVQAALEHTKTRVREQIKDDDNEPAACVLQEQDSRCIAQLLLLVDQLFDTINSWVEYLELSSVEFTLRDFITTQVEGAIGRLLWQRFALQDFLANKLTASIPRPSESSYRHFAPSWFEHKRIKNTTRFDSAVDALLGLEQIYQQVYRFFVQVIQDARPAFYDMVVKRNDFPDTSLIIVANQLLAYSQRALNQYAQKHLNFYYKTILKQTPAPAQPDHTYLCLTLDKSVPSYELAAGVAFNGGSYPDQSPVLFATTADSEVNHIAFIATYGMSYCLVPAAGEKQQYLQTFAPSTEVRKDQVGRVLSSDWFGEAQGDAVQQGFALASDMLFLNAGERTITITLKFATPVTVADFQSAGIALTTAKGWSDTLVRNESSGADVSKNYLEWSAADSQTLQLTVHLSSSFAAVDCLAKANDDYPLAMPYCRIMLPNTVDLQQPLRLIQVQFKVEVKDSDALAPSNDNGLLLNNKAMYILGTRAQLDSHFYLSYPQAFSKPLTSLTVEIDWENIPENLATYYSAYNDFLKSNSHAYPQYSAFSNKAFTVEWEAHQASGWQSIISALTKPSEVDKSNQCGLFAQIKHNTNASASSFVFSFSTPLQCAGVDARDVASNHNPSLRMTLSGLQQGFGNSLYGLVVNDVSLKNAKTLMQATGLLSPFTKAINTISRWFGSDAGKLKSMPNPPLQPQSKRVIMTYEGEQTIDLTVSDVILTQGFALQHLGIWKNYLYFCQLAGQSKPVVDLRRVQLQPPEPAQPEQPSHSLASDQGLALYQGVGQSALNLYFQLEQVQPPCRLNIFVELAQDISGDQQPNLVDIFYWSHSGWQSVTVLTDETHALTRSGIIQLDLPQDMAVNSPVWPIPKGKVNTGWLMFAQQQARKVQCVYCNTQAVKVQRLAPISLPVGVAPTLGAQQIKAPQNKIAAISRLSQPFASSAGCAAQDTRQFEQGVSLRLKSKHRASDDWDYCMLARQAYRGVFYIKRLSSKHAGTVTLGVVQQYTSTQQVNAYKPVMSKVNQYQIVDYLSARVSQMVQVVIQNLRHQCVSVSADLIVRQDCNINDLNLLLTKGVNTYLAPWIDTTQLQYCLNSGLSKAGLAAYIASFKEVEAIQRLSVSVAVDDAGNHASHSGTADGPAAQQGDRISPDSEDAILIPADTHTFNFSRARVVSEGSSSGQPVDAKSVSKNTLTEASV
ncbi:hypothetical protein [Pseudoalteromonas sp. R3]|uniref:hypothetical protein n=1 Tax=Pseudoalteromonas sp. R3 TaxID=1709477 RepID=UPI0006B43690|nr:hypothetical protein [Pseudoalteromonas sp. R3]